MLIEIHMLQNHAPSNLNRDDTGSPKDCIFGGVRRTRISSQSLKRSIRRSPVFQQELGGLDLASRTRQMPDQVKSLLLQRGVAADLAEIAAQKASGFGNREGKEANEGLTAQMMFLTPADVHAVADVLQQAASDSGKPEAFRAVKAADLQKRAELKGWRPITPDIALFGRMITSDAFRDVEASLQVAHAISTHKMEHEFDYFTAVDDLKSGEEEEEDRGAGMIGDVEFTSACYYKYFSLDLDGLVDNLAGPLPADQASAADREQYAVGRRNAEGVACTTVLAFLRSAVFTSPSGKQNTFAAHQLPDAILVEVRPHKIPVSYANAFAKAVRARPNSDWVSESLNQLTEHVQSLTRKFSLQSTARLWLTTGNAQLEGATACDTLDDLLAALRHAMGC
ncbi:MAG: type I-E CRISPR-associated protein Cas7/Cse4/CasC [Thermaerobacter sp.]|nr:type I-E CRISPR-associated protein Cas7/Cse4/CasC [Thermaerobacter sp.]